MSVHQSLNFDIYSNMKHTDRQTDRKRRELFGFMSMVILRVITLTRRIEKIKEIKCSFICSVCCRTEKRSNFLV